MDARSNHMRVVPETKLQECHVYGSITQLVVYSDANNWPVMVLLDRQEISSGLLCRPQKFASLQKRTACEE